jgi:flagellar motor switch protein FliG
MNVPAPVSAPQTPAQGNTGSAVQSAGMQNNQAFQAAQKALQNLSPPERAAAIIALLGPDHAGSVIQNIGDEHIMTFMSAYEQMRTVPRDVSLAIVAEFLTQIKQQKGAVRGGMREAKSLIDELLDADRKERLFGAEPMPIEMNFALSEEEDDVWTRMKDADPKKLAAYLQTQRPQLVAIVISQQSPDNAGVILTDLPDDISQFVIRSMADPKEVDPQTLQIVGQVVEQEFLNVAEDEEEQADPLSVVSSILSVLPSEKREKLMEYLFEKDADQAEKIRKGLVTFEDIPEQLPRNAVPIIFREMPEAELIKALKFGEETAPGSVEYLYSNISQRMAQQFKEQVEELTSFSKKQGEAAQSAMMTLISTLDRQGTIKLIKVADSEDDEE